MILRAYLSYTSDKNIYIDIPWNGPAPSAGDKILLLSFIKENKIYISNTITEKRDTAELHQDSPEFEFIRSHEIITLSGNPTWCIKDSQLMAVWNICEDVLNKK